MFNKIVKALSVFMLNVYVFIVCYLVALLTVSPIMCISLSIISAVSHELPASCNTRFWLVFITCAVPVSIIYFILVKIDQKKKRV